MERGTGFELLGASGYSQPAAAPPSAWECDGGREDAKLIRQTGPCVHEARLQRRGLIAAPVLENDAGDSLTFIDTVRSLVLK